MKAVDLQRPWKVPASISADGEKLFFQKQPEGKQMRNRRGESIKNYFRTDRFISINGQWFFTTREGIDIGPFPTKEEAEAEQTLFLRHMSEGGAMAQQSLRNLQERLKKESGK